MAEYGSEAYYEARRSEWTALRRHFFLAPLPGDSDPAADPPKGGEDEPFGHVVAKKEAKDNGGKEEVAG